MDGAWKKEAGFTLIELLITMSISAILITLAIPSFSAVTDRVRLADAARSLASDLRMGRQLAISKGISVSVVMDLVNDRYHLVLGNDDAPAFAYRNFKNSSEGHIGVRVAGFSNSACDGTITFSPRGTTSCATTITLATAAETRALTVVMTGRVRISL